MELNSSNNSNWNFEETETILMTPINDFDSNSRFDFSPPIPPVSVLNQENKEVVKVSTKKKRGRPSKLQDPNVPKPKKPKKEERIKQLEKKKLEKVPFTIGDVPDDLRASILTGRLSYKNEIVANSGRRNEITTIYQKIIDNYVKGRVFRKYNIQLITTTAISERRLFIAALNRVRKSGSVAAKFSRFEICFNNFKSEDKCIELFRDTIGDKKELEWEMVVPQIREPNPDSTSLDNYDSMIAGLANSHSRKKGKQLSETEIFFVHFKIRIQ